MPILCGSAHNIFKEADQVSKWITYYIVTKVFSYKKNKKKLRWKGRREEDGMNKEHK